MTYDFCTVTDKNFAGKCLALSNSIERHMPGSRLWILCLDAESESLFKKLGRKNIETITVKDLRDPEFETVRGSRTKQEFAWTSKPVFMNFLLEKKAVKILVFADSDVLFFGSIDLLFEKHPGASVMLTSHKFSERKKHLADFVGYFNSGFMVFKNDETARTCTAKWRVQCIEWCHNRHDNGRHGDQAYLKSWPVEFENIEEIPEKGVNLGTWNLERYSVSEDHRSYFVDGEPLIAYHYHGFMVYRNKDDAIKAYPITIHHKKIYGEYINELNSAYADILKIAPDFAYGFADKLSFLRIVKQTAGRYIRKIWP